MLKSADYVTKDIIKSQDFKSCYTEGEGSGTLQWFSNALIACHIIQGFVVNGIVGSKKVHGRFSEAEFKKRFMASLTFLYITNIVLLVIAVPIVNGIEKCRDFFALVIYLDLIISFLAAPNIFL